MIPGISMFGSFANGRAFPSFNNRTPKPTRESMAANENTVLPILDNEVDGFKVEDCFELMKKSFLCLLTTSFL